MSGIKANPAKGAKRGMRLASLCGVFLAIIGSTGCDVNRVAGKDPGGSTSQVRTAAPRPGPVGTCDIFDFLCAR